MKKIILLVIVMALSLYAQSEDNNKMSGVLAFDKMVSVKDVVLTDTLNGIVVDRKSPALAALLSAIVPGSGQLYNGDYLKAGIFFIIDAAALTTAIIYNGKGNDQTNFFESYAEEHWSVERYATWTANNAVRLNPSIDPNDMELLNVFNHDGSVNWNKLNALESRVSQGGQGTLGTYYSHQLAGYQEQQYYEMIGKYAQFNVGWDDFTEDPNDPFTFTLEREDPLTGRFRYYSGERGKANDFYNVSYKAVLVMVVNHILNAAEAAWSASRYNKKLEANVTLEKRTVGFYTDVYPRLNINYNF